MIKIKWEMNDNGSHRLIAVNDKGSIIKAGDWTSYRGICELIVDNTRYQGCSQYYLETLPTEIPFIVTEYKG
jgi:hypothetical protein